MEFDLPSQTSPSVLVWCSDRNPPILEMHVLTSCLELHLNKDIHFCIHMANRKHNIYKDEHSSNKSTHLPVVYVLNTFENLWHMATLYHNTLSHWPIDHRGSVKAKERMLCRSQPWEFFISFWFQILHFNEGQLWIGCTSTEEFTTKTQAKGCNLSGVKAQSCNCIYRSKYLA